MQEASCRCKHWDRVSEVFLEVQEVTCGAGGKQWAIGIWRCRRQAGSRHRIAKKILVMILSRPFLVPAFLLSQVPDIELHSTFMGSGKTITFGSFGKYLVANISTAVPLPGKFLLYHLYVICWSENNGIMA